MEATAPRNLFFYEQCRLCLVNAGVCDVFDTSDLLEDIYNCTGVKVSRLDNLPHKICIKCSEVVASSKELRLLATKNDADLRALFGDSQDAEDMIQISQNSTCRTPVKLELSCPDVISNYFDNSPTHSPTQNSSKEKISALLKEGEENDSEAAPVIRQTISLRKDLFPPSQTASPVKSPIQNDPDYSLLQTKVEAENARKKIKMADDDEETEYVCSKCPKSFETKKKLYLHKRLHNKKICCPLDACGKKFATKGDLDKHLRTHTGERPFLCKICDRRFTQRVSLRAHVTSVHGKGGKEPEDEETQVKDKNGTVSQVSAMG